MDRREVLGALAAAPLAAACSKASAPVDRKREATMTHEDAVLGVKRLGFPWETRDPFLFCVHHNDAYPEGNGKMGPQASLAGRQLGQDFANKNGWNMYHGELVPGFPQHPHRGFETVTVVRRGLVDHSDSLGAAARYGQGDVQWLTAGKGIVHSEMFPLLETGSPNPLELFQIWLNLPKADKFAEPHFSMLWADAIPRVIERDGEGRATEVVTVAGKLGASAPPSPPPRSWGSRPGSDLAIWTIRMEPGARWVLPAASAGLNRTLYFFKGSGLKVGGRAIDLRHGVELRSDAAVELAAGPAECELLMLQGRPIGEPVAQRGPFVMNTMGEIQQAYVDYQRTRFGGWPWPSDEPVHGGDGERFARHADGRVEKARRG